MDTDARRRLADEQGNLLRSLVLGEPAPDGFDASRLQVATRLLGEKRWRQVARARPALAYCLGSDGPDRFLAYAARAPLPAAGAEADGLRFCREAVDPGELSDDARVEQAIAGSRFRVTGGSVVRRRMPAVARVRLRRARRRVVVLRLPRMGARVLGYRR